MHNSIPIFQAGYKQKAVHYSYFTQFSLGNGICYVNEGFRKQFLTRDTNFLFILMCNSIEIVEKVKSRWRRSL